MLLGCIADDFTGASDLANTLARGGMATVQFVDVPTRPAGQDCEAGVLSLRTRSVSPNEAVAQSLAALAWLGAQGCRQILFKYCSTFDSTPRGNIGPVAEALLKALGAPGAIVCPVFPATGRTLFMGHLFVGGRLLNESGMENHPLNPMTDADIRRWLRLQTEGEVGHVPYAVVRGGASEIAKAIEGELAAGNRLIVVDAVLDDDLRAIGQAASAHALVTGGSGIAIGLASNFRRQNLLAGERQTSLQIDGPGLVLSGSCSQASRSQVMAYAAGHPAYFVEPDALMEGRSGVDEALAFAMAHAEAEPIVYSTADPALVKAAQHRYGREQLAGAIEDFFGVLAARSVAGGIRRIVVGGGETSGAVITALGLDELHVGPEIDPGVPVLIGGTDPPLGLALKSGNFGATDFFKKALRALGEP